MNYEKVKIVRENQSFDRQSKKMNYKTSYNNIVINEILGFGRVEREYKRLGFVKSVKCLSER